MESDLYDGALKEFQAAVRVAPEYSEAYRNMGADLQHLGRYQEAEAAYRDALAIKPGVGQLITTSGWRSRTSAGARKLSLK